MIRNILILFAISSIASGSSDVMIDQANKSVDFCSKWTGFFGSRIDRFQPWLVALRDDRQSTPKHFCSGSIISRFFVISAAHCFQNKGEHRTLTSGDVIALFSVYRKTVALSPKKVHVHDEWNYLTKSYDADVALLEFGDEANRFEFDQLFQPICLWQDELLLPDGIVTGWDKKEDNLGDEKYVRWSALAQILPSEQCSVHEENFRGRSSARTFCAHIKGYSVNSGSGLVVRGIDKVYYLKGIASVAFATPADGCGFSDAIFTSVNKFKDWIHQIAGPSLPLPAPHKESESVLSKFAECPDIIMPRIRTSIDSDYECAEE